MGNTKIRIDLSQGIIEAEGEEKFVQSVYDDFKEQISQPKSKFEKRISQLPRQVQDKIKPLKRRGATSTYTPKIVSELDLSGKKAGESLRDFYGHYNVKSNMERNLIFVYYMQDKLKMSGIICDHVFTCYRNIPKIKVPTALYQSLVDTGIKGWIDTKSMDDIKVTIAGINYLEHDMQSEE
jgi:hypothetical protein